MRCEQLRTALSARLDGEPAGVPDRRLDKHVARCAVCRDWLERAERLRGPLLGDRSGGDPSAEWTAGLLARLGAEPEGGAESDGEVVGEAFGEAEGRPGQGDGGRTR
ncbi:zf-HC2 domain-containing protein [Kitasatospora purpeofusca]|uniref:zf-HC2 domain-containing protein n=1 Tax=Kitasatospora purpeofusca TaxID=67352 RepID=UPI00225B4890|nr:zf-HC2 domain-containing protein [Kitasatospora purpeofusca]MCX4756899.1 zf-HC2 domain-containing protein [Kitasatospora purpeofusca]WSR35326.1 zf-HC2 domain-containing protein [Kitasatospora purpeofusca]WSR43646.1 zf-HC2 domain-containing protein [Kitasatospora purpeofusca]